VLDALDYVAKLRDALTARPDIAAMSDADAAASLNAITVASVRDIPTHEVRNFLLTTGEWGAIRYLTHQSPSPQLAAVAWNLCDTVDAGDIPSFRLSDLKVAAMISFGLGALVQANVITSETRDSLLAFAQVTEPAFDREVTDNDVAAARSAV
jgi:hypothetical protein